MNGSGKSSIGGEALRTEGADYINPDELAAALHAVAPNRTLGETQSAAWRMGVARIERAIAQRSNLNLETTLGGNTIPALLERALDAGLEVRMWFVGLDSVERNLARVRARVAAGGHDIPEAKVRERYTTSMRSLVRVASRLTELWVHDNSVEANPHDGLAPRPRLLLHARAGAIVTLDRDPPAWAQPVIAALATIAPA